MGRGKRGRDVGSRLFSLPIVPRALSIFRLLQYLSLFLLGYSRRICGGERIVYESVTFQSPGSLSN